MSRVRELTLTEQSEDDLRENLRALKALARITGSTPQMTKLFRKAVQAQIDAYEAELSRRKALS